MKKIISVIGDATIKKGELKDQLAFSVGKAIIDAGYRLQTGGMGGVMESACKGAKSSKNYKEGDIIAILPSNNITECNEYVDITVPTGLDLMRNVIVASASAVVAIGGGAGTLSELASAWTLKRLVIAFKNVDGWSQKVADTKIDNRVRYEDIEGDKVYGVETAQQAIEIINSKINLYNKTANKITIIE